MTPTERAAAVRTTVRVLSQLEGPIQFSVTTSEVGLDTRGGFGGTATERLSGFEADQIEKLDLVAEPVQGTVQFWGRLSKSLEPHDLQSSVADALAAAGVPECSVKVHVGADGHGGPGVPYSVVCHL